ETANQAALELTGYAAAELLGKPAAELWHDPAHAELFSGERFLDLLRRGAHQRSDMALRSRWGEPIAISWNGSPLRDGDRLLGLVGIARDMRVERRLQDEKLRTIRALAASVAHEI